MKNFAEQNTAIANMSYGPTQLAAAQQFVRSADLSGSQTERIIARDRLIAAATFVGRPDISLTAFLFNLSVDPNFENRRQECWDQFRWIMVDIPGCGSISVSDVEKVLTEMEIKWRYFGFGGYDLLDARGTWNYVCGSPTSKMLDHAHKIVACMRQFPIGLYDMSVEFDAWKYAKAYDRCIETAERIFSTGKVTAEIPHMIFAEVGPIYAKAGDLVNARMCFKRGRELCRDNQVFLRSVGELIFTACHLGEFDRGAEMAREHKSWTAGNFSTLASLMFYTASICALDNSTSNGDLLNEYWTELIALTTQFDERHSNTTHSDYVLRACNEWSVKIDSRL